MDFLRGWHLKCQKHPSFAYIAILFVAVTLTLAMQIGSSREPKTSSQLGSADRELAKSADTYIPVGYVLVPIEIQNLKALNSILGQSGVVDLFLPPSPTRKKPILIRRRVKVLRAPHNQSLFAALVKEEKAAHLLWPGEPLFAVVQNPVRRGAVKVTEEKLRKRRILFRDQQEN